MVLSKNKVIGKLKWMCRAKKTNFIVLTYKKSITFAKISENI